jgi:phytol kinase
VALLAACELAARRLEVGPEVPRKLAHLSCGILAAFLPVFVSFASIVVVAVLFVPFMLASRKLGIFPAVHNVERTTLGEVYFPLGVGLAAALVPVAVPYTYGVLVMALSDAFASLAGGRWGGREYSVGRAHKTVLGSSVFFLTTVALTVAAMVVMGRAGPASLALGLGASVVLTVLEGVLAGGIDNVVLPVAGAALLVLVA